MSFLLINNWDSINSEIWRSLERLVSAPDDLFIELLRYRFSISGFDELSDPKNIEILNNQQQARTKFFELSKPNDEKNCLDLLEGYYITLNDRYETNIHEKYKEKLSEWINSRNLRYSVTEECKIKLTISGVFLTEYQYLKNTIRYNDHLREILSQFEDIISVLGDEIHIKNCITTASNLLEGIANKEAHNPGGTLGDSLDLVNNVFPHEEVKESIKSLYKFFSDYPNLRHAGNPASKKRELKNDDALLILILAIGYGNYILSNNCSKIILNGDLLEYSKEIDMASAMISLFG